MALTEGSQPAGRVAAKARRAWKTQALDAAIERAITPMCKQFGFAEYRLLTEWAQIVGPSFAARTAPVKIRFLDKSDGKRPEGGVLTIHAFDSSVALECSYMEPVILERIAVYFGFAAVKKLMIVQYPKMTERALSDLFPRTLNSTAQQQVVQRAQQAVETVDDPDMRNALSSLAEAFYRRKELQRL